MSSATPVSSILVVGCLALTAAASRADCPGQWLYGPEQGLPGLNDGVYDATSWDPDGAGPEPELLIVGGIFTVAGQLPANRVAAWNGSAWQPLGTGMDDQVGALVVYDGQLIAGGRFTTAGGVTCNSIARWDGLSWQALGEGMGGVNIPSVRTLTVYGGELVAGGYFTTAGGAACNFIARWDGVSWQPLGVGMGGVSNPSVADLTVHNGDLIAGGWFTTAGDAMCSYVARWDGSSWHPLGSGMDNQVSALTVYEGELIAGGYFTTADAVMCNCVARWDGLAWQPLGSGMDVTGDSPRVFALTVYDGELVAGGWFTTAGGVPCYRIACWNGSSWAPVGSGVSAGMPPYDVPM